MRKLNLWIIIMAVVLMSSFSSCAQQPKSANSSEALKAASTMQTTEEKVKFLISEANAFVSSKKFEDAVSTAQYILSNLDANSADARSILEKARADIEKLAQAKIAEAKAEAGKAVSDVKNKINSFGN